jgi:hypothetical protein
MREICHFGFSEKIHPASEKLRVLTRRSSQKVFHSRDIEKVNSYQTDFSNY